MAYKGGVISVRGAEGQIYAGMTLMYIRIPEACRIVEVVVSLATQPSGANAWFDVRKNGTATTNSILSGGSSAPIEITTGQSTAGSGGLYTTIATLNASNAICAKDDTIYIICTQIGSSYSSSDVLVQIRTS